MLFKQIVKRIPFFYKPTVFVLGLISKRKRKKAYHKYGKEALSLFVNCMEESGFPYTLAFGSILGAIREHGFIKHDLDIDTFVWIEDFTEDIIKKLQDVGFLWYRSISIDEDKFGREDSFLYKGVTIDIFYLYSAIDKYPYCCDFIPIKDSNERLPRRVELPISKNTKKVPFEGILVNIPINAEEICEFRYGSNYMTPDPHWHWVSEYNAIKEWPEMQGKTVIKKYPSI